MKKLYHFLFILLIINFIVSCETSQKHMPTPMTSADTIKKISNITNPDSLKIADSLRIQKSKQRWISKLKDIIFVPVFDKRISIVGTFYDSLQIDTLTESYISQVTRKETCNSYDIKNYQSPVIFKDDVDFDENLFIMDTLISLICKAKPRLMLISNNPSNKTLYLNDKEDCQITGILYLINVGDVNSDHKDDIAVVNNDIRYAGCTDICRIFSYKNNHWIELLSFTIYGCYDPYEEGNVTIKIPGFLEKKNDKWYYRDYIWQGLDSEWRLLKFK